jgi:gliding motility-associated protein GldM
MSLPKEPRQKMINMMYLVLTALLALNVSTEVLNAFKTVNNSLERSNKVVDQKNDLTYKAFQANLAEKETQDLAKIWAPPAFTVQTMASTFSSYIERLKTNLKVSAGSKMVDGKEEYHEEDLDAATRMFDTEGHGAKLYDSLIQYRQQLLDLLDPTNPRYASQSDIIKADMAKARADFAKRLPIDTRIPQSQTGEANTGDSAKDWTLRYFHMTPTVAALTILSKFESDVKNSESQIIDYLHKQIGEVKIKFDQFDAIVSPSATYVMPGDDLSIKAGIGAFSAAAIPTINFNGQHQDVNTEGVAEYKTKAEGAGEHTVMVDIAYTKPDGTKDTKHVPVKYTVGVPSGASIFLEKMNVVYVAEDNPVTISGGSVGAEKVHVSFTNGDITKVSGDSYNVVPTTPGEGQIIVDANGKKTPFTMRVKYLPNPTGFVGTHPGGIVSSAEFKVSGGVIAKLDNSEFQSGFTVLDYKVAAVGGGITSYVEASNTGRSWTGQAAAIVEKCTPGTHVFINELRCKGKDGRIRELPSMVFTLK